MNRENLNRPLRTTSKLFGTNFEITKDTNTIQYYSVLWAVVAHNHRPKTFEPSPNQAYQFLRINNRSFIIHIDHLTIYIDKIIININLIKFI